MEIEAILESIKMLKPVLAAAFPALLILLLSLGIMKTTMPDVYRLIVRFIILIITFGANGHHKKAEKPAKKPDISLKLGALMNQAETNSSDIVEIRKIMARVEGKLNKQIERFDALEKETVKYIKKLKKRK